MKFHLAPTPRGEVEIRARMESPGVIGDYRQVIAPGGSFAGHTFAELMKLGPGEHDLEVDDPGDDDGED